MEKKKECREEKIRSEITHAQKVSLVHLGPSRESIEKIQKDLEKRSGTSRK